MTRHGTLHTTLNDIDLCVHFTLVFGGSRYTHKNTDLSSLKTFIFIHFLFHRAFSLLACLVQTYKSKNEILTFSFFHCCRKFDYLNVFHEKHKNHESRMTHLHNHEWISQNTYLMNVNVRINGYKSSRLFNIFLTCFLYNFIKIWNKNLYKWNVSIILNSDYNINIICLYDFCVILYRDTFYYCVN